MSEALKRIKALSIPKNYPDDIDLIRLINYKMFSSCVANEFRCAIVSLIARGLTSALDVAKVLGLSRTAIYRHLNILRRNGILMYREGRYFVAARMFLVFDAILDSDGLIKIQIHPDKGGFIDEEIGLVLVKGELCKCDICKVFDSCLRAVKNFAKKLEVKIRSENPLNAFNEIVKEIVYRDVLNIIRNSYLVVKPISGLEEGDDRDEKAGIQT